MFCLKWLNTPFIDKTEKFPVNEQPEGPIMAMPDLVMRKIMENVDFITMLKLRKVCHAFRDFIDVIKLDNELTKVNIYVTPSTIIVLIHFASASRKSVNLYYIRYGKNCLLKVIEGEMKEAKLIKNQDLVDAFFNDFGFILRNKTKPFKYMNIEESSYNCYPPTYYDRDLLNSVKTTYSIYGCCTSARPLRGSIEPVTHLKQINEMYTLQPTADKFHDRFDCILESRESLIPIQILDVTVLRPSHFLNMARLIDMKQLRCIAIRKTYGDSDEENGKHLVLNEIVELNGFKYIQELIISGFKATVSLEKLLHIPHLKVTISTITIKDVLLNMLTSPTAKSRRVYCDHIEDADTLHNTLGYANPDYHNIYWYFKLPESDQTLQMSKKNHDYGNCFSFKWIKSSCIPKNAVVH
ncbi:hypothetical protein GCK72_011222 [Caenorhabditis remanei]|uniref:F-box domain-containing protein n=1 Tax=Caenorhabditis remanei TaxID=31234 RepID=A0A6A5H6Z2_CAERE|nr:hypothetical protein GCK72_011222 [Caenorhabditis remanei]KAF1762957.1 hypothetical protein GCK72_011222 [Caenorhabditis remanei]